MINKNLPTGEGHYNKENQIYTRKKNNILLLVITISLILFYHLENTNNEFIEITETFELLNKNKEENKNSEYANKT
jgi:hypothetical protein